MLPLESARLLLRPFTADDFDALLAIQSRSDVVRWLYWGPQNQHEVRASLEKKVASTTLVNDDDRLSFAVVLKSSSEVIGDGSLFLLSAEHRQGEIGFIFHPDHHGHGYATETARLLLQLAFDEFGLHRVIGPTRAEERSIRASARAPRHATGSALHRERVREGRMAERGRLCDLGPRMAKRRSVNER